MENVIAVSEELGIILNAKKCGLLVIYVEHISNLLPGLKMIISTDRELLRAPLTSKALLRARSAEITTVKHLADGLDTLQSHAALSLLKNCLATPKLVYLLKCSPTWRDSALLQEIDSIVRPGLESILNVEIGDDTWMQASLPVFQGGLGTRGAQDLAIPAYLASIVSTSDLVSEIRVAFPNTPSPRVG